MSNDPSLKTSLAWFNPKRAYYGVKSLLTSSKPADDEVLTDPDIMDKELENPPKPPVVEEQEPVTTAPEEVTANSAEVPPRRHHRQRHGHSRHSPAPSPVKYNWEERRQHIDTVGDSPQEKGLSPFWTSVITGGAILSLYLAGRQALKWFTTRHQGKSKKEETRRQYNVAVEQEEQVEPIW